MTRSPLLALALAACVSTTPADMQHETFDMDGVADSTLPPPTSITLVAPDNVWVGSPFELSVVDALEGERVFFLVGGDPGEGPCPRPLGGYCLSLNRPVVFLGGATTDGDGYAVLPLEAPPWPGAIQCFQATIMRGPGGVNSALSGVHCTDFCAAVDTDDDGVCDTWDLCFGDDSEGDSDGDGICDDRDTCAGGPDGDDEDGDGVCDTLDICPGADDSADSDGDGIPDGCDAELSCLELLLSDPSLPDGDYIIDPDGDGPFGEITVTCDMTTEGGGWTYYPIDSGATTSRVTDHNSCLDVGLDIVYPRSRDHWVSMLARYDSSYFSTIPGVTNPSGGCGGCTGYAMNSDVPEQSSWQVPDGGRWWIRDTTYSEPNGDYDANCWLSMYNWDVDNLQFNDGSCGYSTSKYICSTNDKG